MYNLGNYIEFLKEKLNGNFFSPLLSKLASLYFFDEQYDNCIKLCNMVTEIYPYYITPKILKIKALIKLEYFSEAENELKEIESRIPNRELTDLLYSSIDEFTRKQSQARIFYTDMLPDLDKFEDYDGVFDNFSYYRNITETSSQEFILADEEILKNAEADSDYRNFLKEIEEFSIASSTKKATQDGNGISSRPEQKDSWLSNIKIVTETIADVMVKQGLYKDAFDAYTLLLRAGHKNKKRILEKISELERRM
jgi:hypothetical protein